VINAKDNNGQGGISNTVTLFFNCTPDLEVEFLELCRALPYWIRCFNVKAYFQNHYSVRNKKTKIAWYTKLSKAEFFTDQKMHLIGATMFITTLIDSALDHPCQHVPSKMIPGNSFGSLRMANRIPKTGCSNMS
jgi:hypothetical protein